MTTDRRAMLFAFGREIEAEGMRWGTNDCSAAPARWVGVATGRTVHLPEYASREDAHALIANAGGLVPLWDRTLAPSGVFERDGAVRFGDIAVIDLSDGKQIGGIVTEGNTLMIRRDDGRWGFFPERPFVKVWAVD